MKSGNNNNNDNNVVERRCRSVSKKQKFLKINNPRERVKQHAMKN